jgi:hypothetical protein
VPFALTVVDGDAVEDVDKLLVGDTDAERERRVEFVDVCVGDLVTVLVGVVPFTRLPVDDTVLDAEGAIDGDRRDDVVPTGLTAPADFVVVWLKERVEVCEAVFVCVLVSVMTPVKVRETETRPVTDIVDDTLGDDVTDTDGEAARDALPDGDAETDGDSVSLTLGHPDAVKLPLALAESEVCVEGDKDADGVSVQEPDGVDDSRGDGEFDADVEDVFDSVMERLGDDVIEGDLLDVADLVLFALTVDE